MRQFPIKFIDQDTVMFGQYTVKRCGCIIGKKGQIRAKATARKRSLNTDADVGLYHKGTRYWLKVQRIVCHCFHSVTGDEWITMEANHKDLNTMNNHADNVEWLFPEENKAHYWATRS